MVTQPEHFQAENIYNNKTPATNRNVNFEERNYQTNVV